MAEQIDPTAVTWDPPIDPKQVQWDDESAPLGERIKRQLGLTARIPVDALAALPLAAAEGGAGLANAFTGGHYSPTKDYNSLMSKVFPEPSNWVEKTANIGGTMIAGSAIPTPSGVQQAPQNFVSAAEAKRRMLAETLKKAQTEGYVVPPATTNPTIKNIALDTMAGKGSMGQAASVKNQGVINQAAAKSVGLNPDLPITPEALASVRQEAGQSYEAIRSAGEVGTDKTFMELLDSVKSRFSGVDKSFPGTKPSPILDDVKSLNVETFDTGHAIDKIDQLRDAASSAFRAGQSQLGRAYKQLSNGLESQIQRGLNLKATLGIGDVSPEVVANYQNARQLIAKTHSVEEALVPGTTDVSLAALARALKGGAPLSDGLKSGAEFASAFQKAAQPPSKIGTAGVNHLTDIMAPVVSIAEGESKLGKMAGFLVPGARYASRAWALGPGQSAAIPKAAGTESPKTAAALAQALANLQRKGLTPETPAQ